MKERIHGLDLIRLASFIAIAFFHISLIHYYQTDIPLSRDSMISRGIEVYARSLSFSGFTIAFLTCVLTGLSGTSLGKRLRLFSFLLGGWVVFSALMNPSYDSFLAWDIYPLVFLGVLTATAGEMAGTRMLRALGLIGFVLLWIPFWKLAPLVSMSSMWANVLGFASCTTEIAEWPILPWIGIVWGGYAVGVEMRRARERGESFAMTRREGVTWGLMLAAGTPWLGAFYGIPLGDQFSCAAYRMDPHVFWAHFVWPMAAIRVSLDPRVQAALGRLAFARWVSRLAISRKFWAAYILNYLIAHLESLVADASGLVGTKYETSFIVFLAIIFLPLTEGATQVVVRVMEAVQARRGGARPSSSEAQPVPAAGSGGV